MSEQNEHEPSQPTVEQPGAGVLRLVPEPGSPAALAEAFASGLARDSENPDWCVDASAVACAACRELDAGASTMSAHERRAIHLVRQRVRAQAVLAQVDEPNADRRERVRQAKIWLLSAAVHGVAFALFATIVAGFEPRVRPAVHEHLFESRAVIPVELDPPTPPVERTAEAPASKPEPPARASPTKRRQHAAEPTHEHAHEPAPLRLEGFELSSEGELAAGEGEGEAWGRPGGTGSGPGAGEGGDAPPAKPKPIEPEIVASPRDGFVSPEYPAELERQGIEGVVLVKVWIDEHGHVIKAEVAESSHHEAFDHNALMAAQRQEWLPARIHGEPVASTRRYRVRFQLERD